MPPDANKDALFLGNRPKRRLWNAERIGGFLDCQEAAHQPRMSETSTLGKCSSRAFSCAAPSAISTFAISSPS